MAGRIITVAPRNTYTVAVTGNGSTVVVPIGQRAYSASDVVSGTLSVRVSSASSFPTGAAVEVIVNNSIITDEEPSTLFLPLAGVSPLTLLKINQGDLWPALYTAGWADNTGAMVSIAMQFVPGSVTGSIALVAGVELILRDA